MHCLALIYADDESLGRLTYDNLSEQALMEIAVEGLSEETKKQFQDSHGSYLDVSDWNGINMCSNYDTEERTEIVNEIKFSGETFEGTLDLSFLPPRLRRFQVPQNDSLQGTLDTSKLPIGLWEFDISKNKFDGSVEFAGLPRMLSHFRIPSNEFSGSCDFTKLPPNLQQIDISKNKFSGSVNLEELPKDITVIDMSFNRFSGQFTLATLGTKRLRTVDARRNEFSGTAVLRKHILTRFLFGGNRIERIFDQHGKPHRFEPR